MGNCRHTGPCHIEQDARWIKVACMTCGRSVQCGIPSNEQEHKTFHALPKWAVWPVVEKLFEQRRIACHVDARTWIAAKERAGYGVQVFAASAEPSSEEVKP